MSSQQPRIALRPPPHRDYLNGYPGIPASDPSKDPPPSRDPLFQLPHLLRPQAHLSGTVEIRSPTKGPALKAKWLSLELEKIETIPPQTTNGSPHQHDSKDKNKKEGRFVELIGTGPSRLWVAGEDQGADFSEDFATNATSKKKGIKGRFKKGGNNDEEDEDGFDYIPDGNYPFKIPLPEGLPPTTDVDNKSSGISYQIVASLCVKGKKGILKGSSKPSILLASTSIILHKADILPVFPAYAPILPLPLPPKLPWASTIPGEPTIGETRESRLSIRRGFGAGGGSEGGEVWMKATRKGSAFGPGDSVPVFVQLGWGGDVPIRLTRLDFVLREQITFRYPSPNNPAYLIRSPPRTTSIFTANASVSTDSNNPTSFAVLYKDEAVGFDLNGIVPASHIRVTVRTAKHIDVAYHLKIRAMIEGGDEIAVDNWPVVIGNVNARVARGIINDIGYVEGLCERAGLTPSSNGTTNEDRSPISPIVDSQILSIPAQTRNSSHLQPPESPLPPAPSPQLHSPAAYSDASTEKRQLLEARSNGTSSFHVSNPTNDHTSQSTSQHLDRFTQVTTPERPKPLRPNFAPSPTAEEEKRRYYEAATKSRDTLQGLRFTQPDAQPEITSPASTDLSRYPGMSSGSEVTTTDPPSPFAYHEASVLKITRPSEDHGTPSRSYGGNVTRSNTTLAASGSEVSSAGDDRSPSHHQAPPPAVQSSTSLTVGAALGRSLTTAESEKKRLFLEAKEMARIRQEEARLELERQNRVLEDFEFEEAQRDFEERLILEAEEERRKAEEQEREAFERRQRELAILEEEKWQREEEERRRKAREELEAKKRRLEMERVQELERFEREQREAQQKRQAEADRWAQERKEEDEMKKRKAEELRRMDEQKEREESERRMAASRKAEMERQRAEDEDRRRAAEQARREEAERRGRAELAAEDERRRQESERHRREEEAAMAAVQQRIERERREEEERIRRAYAEEAARREVSHQAYPSSYGHPSFGNPPNPRLSNSPHQVANSLGRAPSVASFAPSMSAANADSNFYAQQIASGQRSTLNEEKAAYLRQLRQGQNGSVSSPPPPPAVPQQAYPSQYHDRSVSQGQTRYSSHPRQPSQNNMQHSISPPSHQVQSTTQHSSPPRRQETYSPSRSTTPTPAAYRPHQVANGPAPAISSSSTNGYKTAAEEKTELAAAARQRAQEEEQRSFWSQVSTTLDEDQDLPPPSYPVPGSSVSTAPRSAAEEKEELSAYYRAKQAVDDNRQPPPLPPSRQPTAPFLSTEQYSESPSSYTADTRPAYPSLANSTSNGFHQQPPSAPPLQHQPYSSNSSSDLAHSRDPEVSLGKQRAPSNDSFPASSGYPESILRNYSQTPSAPPLPPSNRVSGYYDERGQQNGFEEAQFGSFNLDTRFPEFDNIAERIRQENEDRR